VTSNDKKFSAAFRQSLVAYVFNIFGILAGSLFAYSSGLFEKVPWAVAIYPPILSARGVIGGLFCGRLGTALHLGTIQPRIFGNTKSFYLLFKAIVVLTLETSILMGGVATLFRGFYSGLTLTDLLDMMGIVVATMTIALIIISPLTLAVSFTSFKHGLDPDIVLYPIESTVADFFITAVYVLLLSLLQVYNLLFRYFLLFLSLLSFSIAIYLLTKNRGENEFIKTLKESLLTTILVSFIVNVAGTFLSSIDEAIRGREAYSSYPIYVVYPALIDTIGDVGSTVGSTTTTKLALGTLSPSLSSIRNHFKEITGAWAASMVMFFAYSIFGLAIKEILSPVNLLKFAFFLFSVNILAASIIIMISYTIAIITYQKGLDPDNFEIPLESSLADSVTTISLFISLLLFMTI
jgi:mgtE-like transporter